MSGSKGDAEKALEVVDTADMESASDDDNEEEITSSMASKLLQDPNVMAALQGKLNSMVGSASGYIQSLPAPVKRRLKALKKLQLESTKIEAKFYQEIHDLEIKYHEMYKPIYKKRSQINKGEYEPNEEECEWPSEDEDEDDEDDELSEELKKAKLEAKKEEDKKDTDNEAKAAKGIPEFWLTIFKNVDMLQDMVQEHDEVALNSLEDVTVEYSKSPMTFTLYFHFGANEFFTNNVLTKEYEMKCEPTEEDPFSFEGPEIFKCKGCEIQWKQGKNLTVKTVKKKQKHKSKGSVRTVTKTVKNDSFFNFFDPPEVPEDTEDLDPDSQDLLTSDFEVGHYIRERIIPRAVLYFTGEALEEDDFDEDEEEEEEGEGEEGSDEEADPDFDPSKAPKQQECKQQ